MSNRQGCVAEGRQGRRMVRGCAQCALCVIEGVRSNELQGDAGCCTQHREIFRITHPYQFRKIVLRREMLGMSTDDGAQVCLRLVETTLPHQGSRQHEGRL